MRTPHLSSLGPGLALLLVLPLRTDGGQAECCNLTTSLASTVNNPVAGDEKFFSLPVGPANVMLLVDTSGSMVNLPQCGDMNGGWGSWNVAGQASCIWPTLPALPTGNTTASVGSCDMTGNTQLSWMNAVTPTSNLPDPGRANSLLTDAPSWGSSCTGNACMFSPTAYYRYGDWTETTATQRPACTALDGSGNPITDFQGKQVTADPTACNACMASAGFYFFQVRYRSSASSWVNTPIQLRFAGTWLDANPPKFMTARQVVKDLAWMDPASPSSLDQVRFGLSILPTSNPAIIVVPLGPDCPGSFPATQTGFAQARQYILNAVNKQPTSLYSAISGGTPLATTLFRIGQYFTTPGVYTTAFGSSYELSQFKESVAGLANAPWAQNNPNQHSICWGCQQSSVVIITDGSPNSEMTFPGGICSSASSPACSVGFDQTTFTNAANCGANGANCIDPVDGQIAVLPRVASWLHNDDLRTDLSVPDPQTVQTYAVSFNITVQAAMNILNATANMGAGKFNNASNGQALASAVFQAVNDVVTRANGFGAPATSSLSTIQAVSNGTFLARFKPNNTPTWEGHVYQGMIFDEFMNGCDPTVGPTAQPQVACGPKMVYPNFNGNVDASGHNICNDVFLVDADCDEVVEDPKTGAFLKKGLGGTPARMFWDAGLALSSPVFLAPDPRAGQPVPGYKSADARTILTAVNGAAVPFTAANASALAPLMNLDPAWCASQLQAWKVCGPSPLPACTNVTLQCAQQVINFVRGWDVTDNDLDGCGGPGRQGNSSACPGGADGEQRDRPNDARTASPVFWKLGDVFHSSPVLVKPPADEFTCDTGYENQCAATIHSPGSLPKQTAIDSSYTGLGGKPADAYEAYRLAQRDRQQLLLVGSNDGMIHAFDAGVPDTSQPRNALGQLPYTRGTGTELWAFIPPDLLPRLKDLTQAHQYMVDGSTMVRDVWVDGSSPSGAGLAPPDNQKQIGEYHTLAVLTERSGGTQYTALDVTNPLSPQFLWSFPPPCSDDARFMGQSWTDFAPGAPPIGPVKLALRAGEPDPTGRGFEERWIVAINGGYDPALDRGRAVWMVDAWTGQVLWRFTDDDFKAQMGFGSGTSMFPVVGGVSAVDIGDPTLPQLDQDGFFDTATWADLGGNVFAARFQDPGKPDPNTGRVTNWFAARTFEEQRKADDSQVMTGRSEFYFRPSNAFDPQTKTLRTFVGSGNRERIMQVGPACGPDNLLGCCQAGCSSVTATTTDNYGACSTTSSFSCQNGQLVRSPGTTTCGGSTATCAAAPGNAYTSTVQLSFQCPGTSATSATGQITCNAAGTCSTVTSVGSSSVAGSFPSQTTKSRFYGIWSYGGDPKKMFSDGPSAVAFDRNRFTDVPFTGCSGPTGGSCQLVDTTFANVSYNLLSPTMTTTTCGGGKTVCSASAGDPGWYYEYGDACPLQGCNPSPPWADEKTGASAAVVLGCTAWGSFRPIGSSSGTNPCSGSVGTPVTYGYMANYLTGTPSATCGSAYASGTVYLAAQRSTVAPPSAMNADVGVNAKGQVQYKGLAFPPGGGGAEVQTLTFGTRNEVAEPVYWLEVPRDLHECRHTSAGSCE